MRYDREILKQVVIYHHKVDIKGCLCGWSELGKSIGDHVADVYEAAVRNGYDIAGQPPSLMPHIGVTEGEVEQPEFQCQRTVGAHIYTVKDGIRYDPPLRVPAVCKMAYGHDGDCYP